MPRTRGVGFRVIQVGRQHFKDAMKKDSRSCMIAQAIQDAIPNATHITVDLATIRFTNPKLGVRYTYITPKHAHKAILNFDQGKTVRGFTLKLSEGFKNPAGWRANHPNSKSRAGATYVPSGKTRIIPKRHRKFGLREFTSTQ